MFLNKSEKKPNKYFHFIIQTLIIITRVKYEYNIKKKKRKKE